MNFQEHRELIKKLKRQITEPPSLDILQLLLSELQYTMQDNPDLGADERKYVFSYSGFIKRWSLQRLQQTLDPQWDKLYWDTMLFEAPYLLDSYCLYIEKDRKPQQRFYEPRRKTLIKVVNKLQMLEDDQLDELFVHMPARVGKTQIITLGTSWHCCRNTELSNLYCSYKEDAGGAFLDGVTEIWTDPIYCHKDVFPNSRIVDTDAKANTIDLERKKKYKSLSGKGLTSGLNGLYDATGWLIADDILEGIQDVLSPDILRRKQTIFDNNLMKRKKEKCKVVYNGTIWSLHDIYMNRMAFLENNPEAKDIRWDVLKIPALDPETDESNFDYDYNLGFSTKYYRIERAKFEENDDMASWFSQCQQEPIERDGAVFNPDHMNFYNGVLPNEEPIKIVSACDVALGGSDYLSMPVAYIYSDGSVYIHDVVYDNSEKTITQPKVVKALIKNRVSNAFFEANAGGEMYKDEIDRMLKEKGIEINLVSKFAQQMLIGTGGSAAKTHQRKEQRIWDNAQTIRNFYFRDSGYQSIEYRKFMNSVYSFTINGKNKNDDAPDSLASLAVFIAKGSGVSAEVKIMRRPF